MRVLFEKKFIPAAIIFSVLLLPNATGARVAPSGFFDSEKSEGNTISTGTLDFSLESASDFSGSVTPSQSAEREVEVKNDGSLGFQYKIKSGNFSGDLCDYLKLKVKLDGGSELYSEKLKTFAYKIGTFSAPDKLKFTAELDGSDSGLEGKTCNFDLVFDGWQDNITNFGDGGFSDVETIHNSIVSAGKVVLNEILPDPSGTDNSDKNHSEFVELYNKETTSKDVSGWRIYIGGSDFIEISNETTDGAGTSINGNSFLIVYISKKWGGSILNNSTDSVSLYKGLKTSSELVDSYNYTGSQENKSFTRQPNGTG